MNTKEMVINDVIKAMEPVITIMQLQMLEGAIRGALHGMAG